MKYLVLVFILFTFTYGSQITASYEIEPKLLRLPYDLSESVYWDSNNNLYYGSVSVTKTNNIIYQFDSLKATNHIYYTDKYEGTDKYIYIDSTIYKYVGSISLLERVYIDTNSPPQQYINTLKAIDDSIIICYDKKKFLNELPVYPSTVTLYTNKIGEEFYRTPDYILRPVESNEFRYKDDLIEI